MIRAIRLVSVLFALGAILSACSDGSHKGSTPTPDASGSTTTEVMSAIYQPYADAAPAVEPIGSVSNSTLSTPDGRERRYRVYVPASLTSGNDVPLLVALHGGLGWGEQFASNSGFDGLAESNRFIVVYPDGTNAQGGSTRLLTWNAGMCCGPASAQNVDDVGFISALIDRLERTLPIDPARVFAAGHSNGALLSYRLACELSEQIAAIGVQSGAIGAPCTPSRPVSIFHLHGLADTNIPIDGGRGSGVAGVVFPSPREAVTTFAGLDGCSHGPIDQVDPTNPDVASRIWTDCRSGRTVQFVTVAGASHAWMGHPGTAAGSTSLVGVPYAEFDASRAIWSFLAAQPTRR